MALSTTMKSLVISLCFIILFASADDDTKYVLDSDGNGVSPSNLYYPKFVHPSTGGLSLENVSSTCPLSVIYNYTNSLQIKIYQNEHYNESGNLSIVESEPLYIEFQGSSPEPCPDYSTIWTVSTASSNNVAYITGGGKLYEQKSQFQLVSTGNYYYTINNGTNFVALHYTPENDQFGLVLNKSLGEVPYLVTFVKAPLNATLSAS